MKYVIYLHGFGSSPIISEKAQLLQVAIASKPNIDFFSPNLTDYGYYPKEVIRKLQQDIKKLIDSDFSDKSSRNDVFLVGSSLGGYFSIYLSEYFNLKTVLINPAIRPYSFHQYKGSHKDVTSGEVFEISDAHFKQLREIEVMAIGHPKNFFLLLKEDDEMLNYREALTKFSDSAYLLQPSGGHAFRDFDKVIDKIFNFFNI